MQITNVKVVKNKETGEWVVKAYAGKTRCEQADYFTDDKADAYATAARMMEAIAAAEQTKGA